MKTHRPAVEAEFRPICRERGITFPPCRIYLLAFKSERLLEVWASNASGPYRWLATYPILAASGKLGPKKREGDRQVPEGFYRITHLNPLSRYHLSLRVNYPNAEDAASSDVPRNEMGGNIYVHGKNVSIGCIAIGDAAIEKVFCLTAMARPGSREILISPVDFRARTLETAGAEVRVVQLYRRLARALRRFQTSEGRERS